MDVSALATEGRGATDDWDGAPLPAAAEPSATIRLVYSKEAVGRTYVQIVNVLIHEMEKRLYDLVLVAWGKSRNPSELVFVLALDELGGFLGNAEGLMLYVAHSMQGARDDLYMSLNDNSGDPS